MLGISSVDLPQLALGVLQAGLALLGAPLLFGITRRSKARLQYRHGPPLLQPYRDLAKWWRKEAVESDAATPLTAIAPAIVLATVVVATLLVPMLGVRPLLDGWGDLLVVVGLLALGRFALALSALDAGSAFGGMASSREVAIATLVEPALLLALAGAAIVAGSTDLHAIAAAGTSAGLDWYRPALLISAAAFALIAVAETGHEPVDNPDTHLELTMIHEGMLLEASGPRLAILTYAAELRLVLVAGLFVAVFLPTGLATTVTPVTLAIAVGAAMAKLTAVSVALGLLDATLAKVRILALPGLLATGSILAAIGLATQLWLPA